MNFDQPSSQNELLNEINKDVISLFVQVRLEDLDECIFECTDQYNLASICEEKNFSIGNKISYKGRVFKITHIDLDLSILGLRNIFYNTELKFGVINPYSAILNVLVKEITNSNF